MANFLQMLGIGSPGINPDDYGASSFFGFGGGEMPDYGGSSAPAMPPPNVSPAAQQAPNVFQALGGAPAAAPAPLPDVPTPTRPARSRSSLLDTIGRVSDVLARVGGAEALYQPTLDARQDRALTLGDHDRQVDMDKLKRELSEQSITAGRGTIADAQSARIKQSMKYLQAIRDANPNADVARLWPFLAQRAGLPADQVAAVGEAISQDPSIIDGIANTEDKEKYGGSVVYGLDANGKLVAYQPGLGTNSSRNVLPDGVTPIDPTKVVNLGGATALIGSRTGTPQRILPNTEAPGRAADRTQRGQIAADRNATAITIAGMPARAKDGKTGGGGDASNVLVLLDNIQNGFNDLHGMKALPGDNGGAVGNVLGALGRTHVGQAIGEQAGSPSAQKRLEIMKNVSALQQAMLKSLPASATRTKFEQEMLARGLPDPSKMSYGTARTVIQQLRESFQRAIAESQAKTARTPVAAPAAALAPRPTLRAPVRPRTGGKAPTISNW
jgi:hypothetical protein